MAAKFGLFYLPHNIIGMKKNYELLFDESLMFTLSPPTGPACLFER